MYMIFKTQLTHFFKSKTFIFLAALMMISIIVFSSNALPNRIVMFSILSLDIALISFFQFGGDYLSFKQTNMFKNLEVSNIDPNRFRAVMILFSLFLSYAFTIISLSLLILFTNVLNPPNMRPIHWQYFWWGWFFIYVGIYSILNISIAYFIIKVVSNQNFIYPLFVVIVIVDLLSGGVYQSEYIVRNGQIVGKEQNGFITFQHFLPQWYANQFIVFSFKATSPVFDALKPFQMSGYYDVNGKFLIDRVLFAIMPFIFITSFFALPNFKQSRY